MMKTTFYIIALIFISTAFNPLFGEDSAKEKPPRTNKKKHKKGNSPVARIMSKLTDEEKEKLKALQKKDQVAYQTELQALAKKYKLRYAPISKEILDLLAHLNQTEDEDMKKELLATLSEVVRKEFNDKMEANRKNYEKAAKRLEELKKKIEQKEEKADKIISQRVRQLTKKKPSTEK
jgi:hypothetical protein